MSTVLNTWLESRPGALERAGAIEAVVPVPENSQTTGYTPEMLAQLLGASSTAKSGASVTPYTAIKVSAVYACVSLIAQAIASLCFDVYQRSQDESDDAPTPKPNHPYWWLLNEASNEEDTAYVTMVYIMTSKFFYGDGFAKILRRNAYTNEIIGFKAWHPERVQVFREHGYGKRLYKFINLDGTWEILEDSDVLHITSLGFDGLRSPSPITYAAREAIGNALAAEEFSARFFTNGSTHDIALKSDKNLTKTQIEDLRASYLAKYGGGQNNRSPLLLTGGLAVEKLSITPQDAALLPTRLFTVEEICRIFGVPPFMIGQTDKASSWGTGIEAMGQGFLRYTLRPHLTAIQQEYNRKLWPVRQQFFVAFDPSELTKADFKARMEGYRIAVGRAGEPGWMKPDEVRAQERMPRLGGKADQLFDGGAKPPADSSAGQNPADNSGSDSGAKQ